MVWRCGVVFGCVSCYGAIYAAEAGGAIRRYAIQVCKAAQLGKLG